LASCRCRELQDLAPTSPDVRPFASSENGSHIAAAWSAANCLTCWGPQQHVRSGRLLWKGVVTLGQGRHHTL
jgi:hypothetical protein